MPLGLCFLLGTLQEALQRLQPWFPGVRDPCAKTLSNIPRPLAPSHSTFVEYLLPGPGFIFAGVFGSQRVFTSIFLLFLGKGASGVS